MRCVSSSINLPPMPGTSCASAVSSRPAPGLSQRELSGPLTSTLRFLTIAPAQQSAGPSLSFLPFEQEDTMAQSHGPKPFVLTSFNSTITHSESWHCFGRNFALAYIRAYLRVATGRCLCSPFPTLSSVGATVSQPYLPFGQYQASLGHTPLFPTVSPAHTLVR